MNARTTSSLMMDITEFVIIIIIVKVGCDPNGRLQDNRTAYIL